MTAILCLPSYPKRIKNNFIDIGLMYATVPDCKTVIELINLLHYFATVKKPVKP